MVRTRALSALSVVLIPFLLAACGDDHDTAAAPAAASDSASLLPASGSGSGSGSASAFNSGATGAPDAGASAPLATPEMHYASGVDAAPSPAPYALPPRNVDNEGTPEADLPAAQQNGAPPPDGMAMRPGDALSRPGMPPNGASAPAGQPGAPDAASGAAAGAPATPSASAPNAPTRG